MSDFRRGLTDEQIRERLERDTSSDEDDLTDFEGVTDLLGDEEENILEADDEHVSDDEMEYNNVLRNYNRKVPTYKRKVHDLSSSLDVGNYNPVSFSDANVVVHKATLEKATRKNPAKEVVWTNQKPANIGRQTSENVVKVTPGPNSKSINAKTPMDAWELFFSENILQIILDCTNNKILLKNEGVENVDVHRQITNMAELRAFIGLRYARGLLSRNNQAIRDLYTDPEGHHIFGATMQRNRFEFLNKMITFDDIGTRKKRFEHDRFAAFREVFEMFNDNCSQALNPDGYLSLDETLYPCRTRISFKQYNPSKPSRYGILYKSVNAVQFPYTFRAVVYAGKPLGDPNQFYVPGIQPIVKSLVNGLMSHVELDGNNITMDRLYTSYQLFQYLLEHNITAVGTIMANKKEIPAEVKSCTQREPLSYEAFWDENNPKTSLHSYVVKTKSSGKKNVLLLSSMPTFLGKTMDDKQDKPAILKFYDFSKGGTDIVDQKISYYSCNTKSARWPLTAFSYVLDTARVNAQSIFCLNNNINPRAKSSNSSKFGWEIVLALVGPVIHLRKMQSNLRGDIRMKIDYMLKYVIRETDNNRTSRIAKPSGTAIPVTAPSNDAIPLAAPSNDAIPVAAPSNDAVTAPAPVATVNPTAPSSDTAIAAATLSTSAAPPEHDNEEPQARSGGRKRCALCIEDIQGSGYTQKRARLHVVRLTCSKCNRHICKNHLVLKRTCVDC